MSRLVYAAIASFVMTGALLAGTYTGLITSVTKDEVKFTVRKKGEKGEEKVLKAKNFKITKGEEEVTPEAFTEMVEKSKGKVKGVFGKITTEGEGDSEVVTKIEIGGKGKAKGKAKTDN
jgi:phage tail sheath gpL-like